MLFNEAFIKNLASDPINGALSVCNTVLEKLDLQYHSEWVDADLEILMEAYSIIIEMIEAKLIPIFSPPLQLGGTLENMCSAILSFITTTQQRCHENSAQLKLDSMRSKIRTTMGSGFYYEFSQGDLDIIQHNLNELRDMIGASEYFESEHKLRLLKRLEKLQAELHKKVADLDRFWGLVGDAGIVFGKFGNDAKPIFDRIREIADVVWRTQSRAEELPSGTKHPVLKDSKPESDV